MWYIIPIFTYASSSWVENLFKTCWKKFERTQATTLQMITPHGIFQMKVSEIQSEFSSKLYQKQVFKTIRMN